MSTDKTFLACLHESTGRAIALPLALALAAASVLTKKIKDLHQSFVGFSLYRVFGIIIHGGAKLY